MLNKYLNETLNADSVSAYEAAIDGLMECLITQGMTDEAERLREIAVLKKNRFSNRSAAEDLSAKKEAVKFYMKTIADKGNEKSIEDIVSTMLKNFPEYCRKLYMTKIHNKCSSGIKEHLTGFHIDNEYDLQKLMLPLLIAIFPDTRAESVQDTGHHTIRKDIIIDSINSVIELKCTRPEMTERQLSEEIASDMVHYETAKLFFYIYDKAGVIQNPFSFIKTYEEKDLGQKLIKVIVYSHGDL